MAVLAIHIASSAAFLFVAFLARASVTNLVWIDLYLVSTIALAVSVAATAVRFPMLAVGLAVLIVISGGIVYLAGSFLLSATSV